MAEPRRLAQPRPAQVSADRAGQPQMVAGRAVAAIRETWLLEDRWWTDRPLRRRYWEVVTTDGLDLVVFHDLVKGGWWRAR
jgi:CO dehydrogenase/acetyl-CoA synthase delta subunit